SLHLAALVRSQFFVVLIVVRAEFSLCDASLALVALLGVVALVVIIALVTLLTLDVFIFGIRGIGSLFGIGSILAFGVLWSSIRIVTGEFLRLRNNRLGVVECALDFLFAGLSQ